MELKLLSSGKVPPKNGAVVSPSGEEQHHKQYSAPMAEKVFQCGYSSFGCLNDPKEWRTQGHFIWAL